MASILPIYLPGYYLMLWIAEHVIIPLVAWDPYVFFIGLFGLIGIVVVVARR